MLENLLATFPDLFLPTNMLLMVAGLVGGIIVGALPGLTATMAVALMVPVTFSMEASSGLVMLGAIYVGAIYGGSNPAILICTPGTPSSVATTFDGWPLCQAGKADIGLYTSLISSSFGGLFGTVILLLVAAPLARFALQFGAPETFWLCLFGLSTLAVMSSGNAAKGIASGIMGLLFATIGIDLQTGMTRFTFGCYDLVQGIGIVPSMIGLFSLAQVLVLIGGHNSYVAEYAPMPGAFSFVCRKLASSCKILLLRSSIIGSIIGMLPGAGGEIASIISYNESKRWDRHPEKYGKGAIEGLAASEAANNAVIGGSLIPMLTLGIPGSAVAAVMLGALLAKGILPGFKVFSSSGGLVHTFVLSQFLVNILLIPIGYILIKFMVRIIQVRIVHLVICIVVLSVIGAYAVRNDLLDIYLVVAFGFIGYFCNRTGLDTGAMALGIILGPMVDENLGKCLQLGDASGSLISVFAGSPISIVLVILTVLSLLSPVFMRKVIHVKGKNFKKDLLGGLACLGTAIAFLVQMDSFTERSVIYPLLLCSLLIVLAAFLLVRSFMERGMEEGERIHGRPVISLSAMVLGYGMIISILGFYLASLVFMIVAAMVLEDDHRRAPKKIGYALVFSCCFLLLIYGVFSCVLNVPVPGMDFLNGLL